MTVVDRAPTRALACPSPRRRAPGVAVSRRERALRRAVVASWRAYAASTGARRRARRAYRPRKRSSDDRHRSSVIGHRSSLVARLMMWLVTGTITPSQRPIVIRHHVTHTHKDQTTTDRGEKISPRSVAVTALLDDDDDDDDDDDAVRSRARR